MWYRWDPRTLLYIGETKGQPSPLEPGSFFKPAHSTETKPPTFDVGEIPMWDGEKWFVMEVPKTQEDLEREAIEANDPPKILTPEQKSMWAAGEILVAMSKAIDEKDMLKILVDKIKEVTGG